MTLEASLVMPMVICVLALLVYFSFFLYGRCVLAQDSYVLAFRATALREDETPSSYVAQNAETVAGRKYFGNRSVSFDTSVSGKEVRVTGTGETKHGAMGAYFLKPRGSWGYSAQARATGRQYAGHIRKLTRLKDIGKEILDIGEK